MSTRMLVAIAVAGLGLVALLRGRGCISTSDALEAVDHVPSAGDDWEVSSPQAEGLETGAVDRLYRRANGVPSTYAVLVVRNGRLVAEAYFNGWSAERASSLQSVTKSVTSALVGIAIARGDLEGVEQRMMEFFPEFAEEIQDSRKEQITLRHLLQMRAGYVWEESSSELFDLLYHGFRPRSLVDVPLSREPGTGMEYSNLSYYLLGVILARATGESLDGYATKHLFDSIGVDVDAWTRGWEGHILGFAELSLTAREMARVGQLYLDNGEHEGAELLPSNWVDQSLQSYSPDAWRRRVGRNFRDFGYGYGWWSARVGQRRVSFAWGHGGQVIAIVPELELVVVVKSDPQIADHSGRSWRMERANLNLAADFIASVEGE